MPFVGGTTEQTPTHQTLQAWHMCSPQVSCTACCVLRRLPETIGDRKREVRTLFGDVNVPHVGVRLPGTGSRVNAEVVERQLRAQHIHVFSVG
jgi:hypothetical protein